MIVRSIIFNVLFYLELGASAARRDADPQSYRAVLTIAKTWGRTNLGLLRAVAGIDCEIRGREKIPLGPLIVASKHQSAGRRSRSAVVRQSAVHREVRTDVDSDLRLAGKDLMPVDRSALAGDVRADRERARGAGARPADHHLPGRHPPTGRAEPSYKFGVAHLYQETGSACVPIALNSGLFWPRRSFRRFPGTVIVEVLDPIAPGLDRQVFADRLQQTIEAATARLAEEGERELARNGIKTPTLAATR